jgi:quercetin dioxygenase-like cupin family protein
MDPIIRHIARETAFRMADQVDYLPGQVVSKTLAQNKAVSLTVFSFDQGEEISTHESGGDALVTVLDGTGQVTIDGHTHVLQTGESILMPARIPHAVYGIERFKMLLTVVFPS